ncbi:permease [Actinomycetospora sp. CA-084318]|uniref:permease n=1 Tax=Actinomycetospora sp. CA-084318 TaxID=3239892 RepID=UPI003D96E95C
MTTAPTTPRRPWIPVAGVVLLAVVLLVWAKWQPYWVKVPSVAGSGSLGSSILPADGVSLRAGLAFAGTFLAIWPALVTGLVLAAAIRTVLPADWTARVVGRRGSVVGSALAVPGMMCSCCSAPVAVGLRQRAADVRAALAFWLASPALNPVVLVFCAFVLPWPWTLLRLAAGLGVVGIGALAARRAGDAPDPTGLVVATDSGDDGRPLPIRFLGALGSLSLRLLPEYLVLVVALGALRGVLFPVGAGLAGTHGAVVIAVVVLLAVAGTLLPIPTGAEIAAVAALLAAGVSPVIAAALLITLPAISLPSLLMVRRVFPTRVLATVTVGTVLVGVACAVVVAVGGSWTA